MATKEELEQEKNLANLNKLIFRMHAESVPTSPPDLRNAIGYDAKPRQEFANSEIATTIQHYQDLCAKMKESLDKAPNLDDDTKADIATNLQAVTDDLKKLHSSLNTKFDDWMGNRRHLDKASWDKSFAGINQSVTALQDKVTEVSASQNPPTKALDGVQKHLDDIDLNKLQNTTFHNEVSRLQTELTQQSRTDFGFLKATELGYGANAKKKLWVKVHKSDEKKIEEEAEKILGDKKIAANIGIKDEKDWSQQLAQKGGPGLYRQPGSPFYMKVDNKGGLTALPAAEDSFLSQVAQTALMMVAAPFLPLIAIASRETASGLFEDGLKKLRNFWLMNFEKQMEEMMDFITLDPSGLLKNRSVVMSYNDYSHIGKEQLSEVMITLKLAEKRGLKFDIAPELAEALTRVKGHEKVLKAIEDYQTRYLVKQKELEASGEGLAATPPTPPIPARPALSDADKKTLSDHVAKLNEVKQELVDVKPDDEMKMSELESKYEVVREAKDGIVQAINVSHANESELKVMEAAVNTVQEVADVVTEVAAHNDNIKQQANAGVKLPISAEPEKAEAYANYQAVMAELREKLAAINDRKEELVIQRQLEDDIADLGHADIDPHREESPVMDFKAAVSHGVDSLNHALNQNDAASKKDKIEKLKGTTQQGVTKLGQNPAHKDDADKLQEKVTQAGDKLDTINPSPAPKPH